MSKPLPKKDFMWKRVKPIEEVILKKKRDRKNGWIPEIIRTARRAQQLSPGTRGKGRKKDMDAGLQKELDKRPGAETSSQDSQTLKDKNNYLVHYKKLTALSEAGHETEMRAQGAGVQTRILDGAVHPHEYRIQEKCKQRL